LLCTPTSMRYSMMLPARWVVLVDASLVTYTSTRDCGQGHKCSTDTCTMFSRSDG
jgi:hypothetical protein